MFIAHIPTSILSKIKRNCFSFLWTSRKEKEGKPLIKWSKVTNLKKTRGWGLKKFMFLALL
jgi:hypothetical protein